MCTLFILSWVEVVISKDDIYSPFLLVPVFNSLLRENKNQPHLWVCGCTAVDLDKDGQLFLNYEHEQDFLITNKYRFSTNFQQLVVRRLL